VSFIDIILKKGKDEMKLEDMRKEVANLVDDESYSPEEVVAYINEAIQYASGLVKLPSLKRVGSVSLTADGYSVSLNNLTDELIGKLTWAVLSTGKELNILSGVEEMLMAYPSLDKPGVPKDIALEHKTLWYHPMGDYSASIIYYTRAALLAKTNETPSDFPEFLHRKLFVHGAAWMIYDQIEDGIEGEKLNTKSHFYHSFHEDNKNSGIIKLREWIAMNRVHHISSTWRY
jgi:hypothetical protein